MVRLGRWISLLPILALIPRLGLIVISADRQTVGPDTRAALLWISSTALAALVGCAEVYVGVAVVSRRHGRLALVWAGITVLLNALIVPLSLSGLEAIPVWEILSSRALRLAWGSGLGLLSTLCVGGCLWADVVREGSELVGAEEGHRTEESDHRSALRGEVSALRQDAERATNALEVEVSALRQDAERASSALGVEVSALRQEVERAASALAALEPRTEHAACPHCGYWNADQRRVAGHVLQCRKKAGRSSSSTTEGDPKTAESEDSPGTEQAGPA
jgi:hypothetical protein